MDSCWPKNRATALKMLIEEAMEGRELAKQLQNVLAKSDGSGSARELAKSDGSGSARDLVMKILKSFYNVLFILNVKEGVDQVPVISPIQAESRVDSPCLDARKAEDSHEISRSSTKRTTSTATPTKKDRRGCYDRRRTSRIWKRETQTLTNDGQAWRKNGQKVILDSKYLRHYFRCSYKYDQGCKATKHVQRIQANPPLYRTTYFGQHTCNKDIYTDPELFMDCASPSDTSKFISFDNTNHPNKQEHPFFLSTKQEYEDKKTCDNGNHNHSLSSKLLSGHYNPDDDVVVVESPCRLTMVSSSTPQESSGYEDVNYDHIMEYVDCFDPDLFQFD